jgi:predicted phage terminase large subunit-like protein
VEGSEFKRNWIQYYSNLNPTGMNTVILVDPASGRRKKNDYTSMWALGLGTDGNRYVLDIVRDKLNLTERASTLFNLHRKWKPAEVRYEQYGMMADIEHIRSEMDLRSYRFAITEVGGSTRKEDRIRRLVPIFQKGRIWFPHQLMYTDKTGESRDLVHDFIETEYLSFPVGRHDDMMDGLARSEEPELSLPWPMEKSGFDNFQAPGYGVLDPTIGY